MSRFIPRREWPRETSALGRELSLSALATSSCGYRPGSLTLVLGLTQSLTLIPFLLTAR